MDIIRIIDSSLEKLPPGDYLPGLKAVRRHINIAVKHFEREDDGLQDSFTDAIYRCNQAFEGGLKEAYRVLAGKDPDKLTPHKIEEYLEGESLIRPRALKQLTRYREDYRNPSTHDYKLDFDEDEALLAIVAVRAFTKLLINQIAGKAAFDAGSTASAGTAPAKYSTLNEFAAFLSAIICEALPKLTKSQRVHVDTLNSFIDGAVSSKGISTNLILDNDGDNQPSPWDNVASSEALQIPIEGRVAQDASIAFSASWLNDKLIQKKLKIGILVIFDRKHNGDVIGVMNDLGRGRSILAVVPNYDISGLDPQENDAIRKLREGVWSNI